MPRPREFDETLAIEKAIDLFCKKGYNATSANDLVDNLGLSRSSIYATFSDKHTLFIKCLQKYSKNRETIMTKMIRESDDILETLQQFFNIIIDQDAGVKIPNGCLIVNTGIELAAHDKDIEKIVHKSNTKMISILETAIKKGQKLNQITKTVDSKNLAQFVFNTISGIRVSIKSTSLKMNYDGIVKICLESIKAK